MNTDIGIASGTILALETATEQSSIALVEGDDLIFELSFRHGRDLSRWLASAVRSCLKLSGRNLDTVQAAAVSVGPGSFTGLRIGVTTAKTLAFALSVPNAAVSTLEVLAAGAVGPGVGVIVPLIDARRGEVFTAAFRVLDGRLDRVREDQIVAMGELQSFVAALHEPPVGQDGPLAPVTLVAAGKAAAMEETLSGIRGASLISAYPQARHLAVLGQQRLVRGDTVDPFQLVPSYLRRSYAEEKAELSGAIP